MSVTIVFYDVKGSMDDIYDSSKIITTKYKTNKNVPDIPNPTPKDLFESLPESFTKFWRIIWAGNVLDWNDCIPPTADGKTLYMISPICHWSNVNFKNNDPLTIKPSMGWEKL